MRRYLAVVVLLIAAVPAFAAEWTIDIDTPRKRIVKADELSLYCNTDRKIEGCMEFVGESLRCECRRTGRTWSIAARAHFIPNVYMTNSRVEKHELEHLDDLRLQLAGHLTELTARRFASEESCKSAADFELTVFNLRMDLFRKLSNERLH